MSSASGTMPNWGSIIWCSTRPATTRSGSWRFTPSTSCRNCGRGRGRASARVGKTPRAEPPPEYGALQRPIDGPQEPAVLDAHVAIDIERGFEQHTVHVDIGEDRAAHVHIGAQPEMYRFQDVLVLALDAADQSLGIDADRGFSRTHIG